MKNLNRRQKHERKLVIVHRFCASAFAYKICVFVNKFCDKLEIPASDSGPPVSSSFSSCPKVLTFPADKFRLRIALVKVEYGYFHAQAQMIESS